jgi:hypothetical protein
MSKHRCANGRRYCGTSSAKGRNATSQKREVEWREKVRFSRGSTALGRNGLQFNTARATNQRLLGKFADASCGLRRPSGSMAFFFRFDVKMFFPIPA